MIHSIMTIMDGEIIIICRPDTGMVIIHIGGDIIITILITIIIGTGIIRIINIEPIPQQDYVIIQVIGAQEAEEVIILKEADPQDLMNLIEQIQADVQME